MCCFCEYSGLPLLKDKYTMHSIKFFSLHKCITCTHQTLLLLLLCNFKFSTGLLSSKICLLFLRIQPLEFQISVEFVHPLEFLVPGSVKKLFDYTFWIPGTARDDNFYAAPRSQRFGAGWVWGYLLYRSKGRWWSRHFDNRPIYLKNKKGGKVSFFIT